MTTPVTQSVLRLNTFFATNNTNLTLIAKDLKSFFVARENQIQEGLI
jgi:hypothetical protein